MSRTIEPPVSAADVPATFARAFNAGTPEAVLALYEPDAVLIADGGGEARGEALVAALRAHLALGLPIDVRVRRVVEQRDVALLVVDWSIGGEGRDAAPAIAGVATDVVRRGEDGRWRYAIDNPLGLGQTAAGGVVASADAPR